MRLPFYSLAIVVFALCTNARAEDAFFEVPLTELRLTDGKLPGPGNEPHLWHMKAFQDYVFTTATLERGEAFLGTSRDANGQPRVDRPDTLYARVPAGVDVSGRMFLEKADDAEMVQIGFVLMADKARADARTAFYRAQLAHYQDLLGANIPGAAWFRHRAEEARKALGPDAPPAAQQQQFRPNPDEVDDTYTMFSGGRAVSENLQLDRAVPSTQDTEPAEDIDSIYGVSAAEIDWKPLIKDLHPALDPLAEVIPADQHAIFFPSFDAMRTTIEYSDSRGTPVLALTEERSEDFGTKSRYEKQLGLSLSDLSKLLGPILIDSVAVTGCDPYLRVGSDVAVLFQTKNPAAVAQLLLTRAKLSSSNEPVGGETGGLEYQGVITADRSVCCFVAKTADTVIVTNSLVQLDRLAAVLGHRSPALSSAPEYIYFRNRYPRGASDETAFVILTDATIRRWCGPRWRIADSRRTRAAAQLAELQAQNLDALVTGKASGAKIDSPSAELGDLRVTKAGVTSSVYGSLNFMTPICELPITKVSHAEKVAYTRWRNQYQSYWKWAFDPIAAKLTINDRRLGLDLSIIPLIFGTDYRTFVDLSRGVDLSPDGGDPHESLFQFAMAINRKSSWIQMGANFTSPMVPADMRADPFSWLGKCVSFYFDDDPFWADLEKCRQEDLGKFLEKNAHRVPLGIYVESNSALKLAAFVTGVRAFIEQTAPGMTVWESMQNGGRSYVKISPSEAARAESKELEKLNVFYAPSGKSLIIAINEDVLKRALDRQVRSGNGPASQPATRPTTQPWLGSSVAMRVKRRMIDLYSRALGAGGGPNPQIQAWSNLPILNEWKRLYPEEDPVAVHKRIWGATLICPGEGHYVWNAQLGTMESTTFGSPIDPKSATPERSILPDDIKSIDSGLTFEDKGLRARVVLEK